MNRAELNWDTPASGPLEDIGSCLDQLRSRASGAPAVDFVALARQLGYPVRVGQTGELQRLLVERAERCHRIATITPFSERDVAEALDAARRLGQRDEWTERGLIEVARAGMAAHALIDMLRKYLQEGLYAQLDDVLLRLPPPLPPQRVLLVSNAARARLVAAEEKLRARELKRADAKAERRRREARKRARRAQQKSRRKARS